MEVATLTSPESGARAKLYELIFGKGVNGHGPNTGFGEYGFKVPGRELSDLSGSRKGGLSKGA